MDFRSHILNSKPKTESISTPFWSKTDENGAELVDGHIGLQDIPGDELGPLQMAMEKEPFKAMASIACKSLINTDTGERIFSDADRDTVAHLGSSILLPLYMQLQSFLGLDPNAVEKAKKNLEQTLSGAGGSSSANGHSTVR